MGRKLSVAIPDTVLEEKDSPRDKALKLGLIARACAIYGVDVIEVFRDPGGRGEGAEIHRVLEYLETPQYLRRRLYPLDEGLKYAGVLPPLRIPSHRAKVPIDRLPPGEIREGVANADGTVDIGLDRAPKLRDKAAAGKRVTVRVTSLNPFVAELYSRERTNEYWGYRVEEKAIAEVFSDPRFKVKIATSRLGRPLSDLLAPLQVSIAQADGVKLIFGSPSKGLFDIVGRELTRRADFVVNLFPEQKVETVRAEEAIFAGLNLVTVLTV